MTTIEKEKHLRSILAVTWRCTDARAYVETVSKNPAGASPALFSLPDIITLPGGVAIKRGNEIVAGLGVGGAPGAIGTRPARKKAWPKSPTG